MRSSELGRESLHGSVLFRGANLQRLASLKDHIRQLPIIIADLFSVEDGVLNFLRDGDFFRFRFLLQFQETSPNQTHIVCSSPT
jgi:hypothetical protein